MKRIANSKIAGLLLVAVLFITACGTEIGDANQLTKQIPNDAAMVTSMNFQNLLDKADFESVKKMEFYQKTLDEVDKENVALSEILNDPSNSGINLGTDAYLFVKNDEDRKRQIIGGLLLSLADKQTFEKLLSRLDFSEVVQADGYQYTKPRFGNGLIAWNEEIVFVTGANRGTPKMTEVDKLFTMEQGNSVAAAPNFKKTMSKKHDFTTWINLNPLVENLPPAVLFGSAMAGISKEDMLDNYMYANWDFEDGSMQGMLEYDIKKSMTKDIALLFKNTIKTDFSNKIPGENLILAATIGMDFKGLNQVLNEKGFLGSLNESMEETGLEFKDLATAFGGDVAFSAYKKDKNDKDELLITTNIIDQKKATQFFESGVRNNVLRPISKNKYLMKAMSGGSSFMGMSFTKRDMTILVKGDLVYLSTDSKQIDEIETGGFITASKGNKDLNEILSSNVFGLYADLVQMGQSVEDINLNHLENLKISGNRDHTSISMDTDSPSENSLKTLMKMMNEAYKKDRTGRDTRDNKEI